MRRYETPQRLRVMTFVKKHRWWTYLVSSWLNYQRAHYNILNVSSTIERLTRNKQKIKKTLLHFWFMSGRSRHPSCLADLVLVKLKWKTHLIFLPDHEIPKSDKVKCKECLIFYLWGQSEKIISMLPFSKCLLVHTVRASHAFLKPSTILIKQNCHTFISIFCDFDSRQKSAGGIEKSCQFINSFMELIKQASKQSIK